MAKQDEKRKNVTAINKWKADLQQRKDKMGDLDSYVKAEHKKNTKGKKFAGPSKAPDDKYKNMKSKKIVKGKRLGKVARIKKRQNNMKKGRK